MPDPKNKAKVVVLGGAVIDLTFTVRNLPEWTQAVQASSFRMYAGGKGLNQAVAASRLGVEVCLISAVGKDEFGERIIETLDMHGISRDFVRIVDGRHTDVTNVFVNDQGDAAFVGWKNMTASNVDHSLVKSAEKQIAEADALLMTLEISLDAAEEAIGIAKEKGVCVFLNPAPPPDERLPINLLQKVDVLTPNSWEAIKLLGLQEGEPKALARLLHQMGVRVVCVTTAENGCVAATNGNVTEHPPFVVGKPVDSTGASDAFCASLAVALVRDKMELKNAIFRANVAGAIATGKRGSSPSMPTSEEIEYFLRHWKATGVLQG